MRPCYLRLRNFKGILSGMGLQQVEINYDDLPSGIIVFDAPNGRGKSTILDASTPYRLLPYRAGSTYSPNAFNFHDHCVGDWERELIFEMNGVRYRSLIKGDADRKKQEAWLHQLIDGAWRPVPGVDGKLGSYDDAVERIVGSPELFMTSIFRCQNAKALSDYSRGDIKELFVELLNINHLAAIGEKARRVKQAMAGKTEALMRDRAKAMELVAGEETRQNEQSELLVDIADADREIRRIEDQEIPRAQGRINEIDVTIAAREHLAESRAAIEKEIAAKEGELSMAQQRRTRLLQSSDEKIRSLSEKIKSARQRTEGIARLREKAAGKTVLERSLIEVKEQLSALSLEENTLRDEINDLMQVQTVIATKERELSERTQAKRNIITTTRAAIETAEKHAATLKRTGCPLENPTCNLLEAAVRARDSIPGLQAKLAEAAAEDPDAVRMADEISELKKIIADLPGLRKTLADLGSKRKALEVAQRDHEATLTSLTTALEGLPVLEAVETQIPGMEADLSGLKDERSLTLTDADVECDRLAAEASDLRRKVSELSDDTGAIREERASLMGFIQGSRQSIADLRFRQDEQKLRLGAVEESLRQIEQAKADLLTINGRVSFLNDEMSQWATLETAFGNEGIIALELDDCGPQISSIANELLKVFGGRFAVRIDTQTAKAGNSGAMKEVFDITVFDNETNEQKSIKRLSGGEKTWIEDALTKSICIYNKNASGRNFKTLFTDEKDGALDAEKKKEFFLMKRRVLELGGYERELAITQSEELKAMADATIRLDHGKIEIITN